MDLSHNIGFAKEHDVFGPTFKVKSNGTKPVPYVNDTLFTITPPNGELFGSMTSLDAYLEHGSPEPPVPTVKPGTPTIRAYTPIEATVHPVLAEDPPVSRVKPLTPPLVHVKPLTPPIYELDSMPSIEEPSPKETRAVVVTNKTVVDNSMSLVPLKQQHIYNDNTISIADPALAPETMQRIPGYEGISFDLTPAVPPPYDPVGMVEINHMPTKRTETNLPEIKEYHVREALVSFAKKTCCYGTTPAKEMILLNINSDSIFHYSLDTFCEKRETSWHFEPYRTNVGINVGHAPGPWDIPVPAPKSFMDAEKTLEVPNTSVVRQCHNCGGIGRKMCNVCHGKKKENCNKCYGSGLKVSNTKDKREEICRNCHGTGKKECKKCNGKGHKPCKICSETGNLRFFVRLKVEWKTHTDDKITESILIPIERVREVTGEVALEEVGPKLAPIKYFPDEAVNVASQALVNEHHSAFPLERILEQRQRVRIIPLAEVSYSWKNRQGKFFVYGFENKVHFPDYPDKYCWGCTIS